MLGEESWIEQVLESDLVRFGLAGESQGTEEETIDSRFEQSIRDSKFASESFDIDFPSSTPSGRTGEETPVRVDTRSLGTGGDAAVPLRPPVSLAVVGIGMGADTLPAPGGGLARPAGDTRPMNAFEPAEIGRFGFAGIAGGGVPALNGFAGSLLGGVK